MAHYAILNENNIVTQVIVGKDENEPLPEGYTSWEEYYGGLRTSYNTIQGKHTKGGTPFRKNFAGIGWTYNSALDAFIPPKGQNLWELNTEKCTWEPRTPNPQDGRAYDWDQESYSWILRA